MLELFFGSLYLFLKKVGLLLKLGGRFPNLLLR